ncbi:TonB-dependent receptor plug domain-containing protein [Caulobacter segnis]
MNGRGATISIRGLGPQYAKVTLNGQDFANPNFIDGFRFDIIQTELASSVQVYKSPTADMDAGRPGRHHRHQHGPAAGSKRPEADPRRPRARRPNWPTAGSIRRSGSLYANQLPGRRAWASVPAPTTRSSTTAPTTPVMDRWYTASGAANEFSGTVATPAGTLVPRRFRYRRIDRTSDRTQFNAGVEYKAADNLKLGFTGVYSKDATKYNVNQMVFGNFAKSSVTPVKVANGAATVVNLGNFTFDNNRQLEDARSVDPGLYRLRALGFGAELASQRRCPLHQGRRLSDRRGRDHRAEDRLGRAGHQQSGQHQVHDVERGDRSERLCDLEPGVGHLSEWSPRTTRSPTASQPSWTSSTTPIGASSASCSSAES